MIQTIITIAQHNVAPVMVASVALAWVALVITTHITFNNRRSLYDSPKSRAVVHLEHWEP